MKRANRSSLGPLRRFDPRTRLEIPLCSAPVSAGFPSPADDFVDRGLDLNEHLVRHPAATFFVRVEGTSMLDAGIHPGDLLIVDRALEPRDGAIVIAVLENEFVLKRYRRIGERCLLVPENSAYAPMEISGDMTLEIWGVVTYIIHEASAR